MPLLPFLALALLSVTAAVAAPSRPPNVILVLIDDLGWRDLGSYGSTLHETPNLDRFARESVRFTDAYAACHVCSPTRASILTGKYPARLHLTDWLPGRKEFPFQRLRNAPVRQHLPLEETTLAEALRARGYATGHFGKWHLGEEPHGPRAQGFDVQVPRWNKGWPNPGFHAPFKLEGIADEPGQYLTDRLTDEALRYIEEQRARPFFLYLSHFAVHDPIQAPAALVEKYRAKLAARPSPAGPAYVLEGNPDDARPPTRAELAALAGSKEYAAHRVFPNRSVKIRQHQDNPVFAAMVENLDQNFGRLTAKLDELGLAAQTIVIFVSDNGGMAAANFGRPDRVVATTALDGAYSTSNLPLRGAKGWLYEGGIRVPLMIRAPGAGVRGGRVSDVPVITTDLYPTVLELAGLPALPDQHRDGVSLAPLLRGGPTPSRDALFWHFPHYSNHGRQSPGAAIRAGEHKLLLYFEQQRVQLFNLRADPGEQDDLAATQPALARALTDRLRQWQRSVGAAAMEPNPEYRETR